MIKVAFLFLLTMFCCQLSAQQDSSAYLLVLGVAQDGGYPHAGCEKKCCTQAWANRSLSRRVVSLALVAPGINKWWLFEATPDITEQLHRFRELTSGRYNYVPDGIFITHAHIGHYAGLIQLGREVMNTQNVPVYVLPKMKSFLESNGPWSQLVKLKNIELTHIMPRQDIGNEIYIDAFTVPHRDEFSETAGFRITTKSKKYLFIPDIDKWEKWNLDIRKEVAAVDIALVDATFYKEDELPGRNMSEVPHPFVLETMSLFQNSSLQDKSKIYFIHFNHTNPLMWDDSRQAAVRKKGFSIAEEDQKL